VGGGEKVEGQRLGWQWERVEGWQWERMEGWRCERVEGWRWGRVEGWRWGRESRKVGVGKGGMSREELGVE